MRSAVQKVDRRCSVSVSGAGRRRSDMVVTVRRLSAEQYVTYINSVLRGIDDMLASSATASSSNQV